ncbi:DBP1, partial [Symbiodinium sp. CCMP2456]
FAKRRSCNKLEIAELAVSESWLAKPTSKVFRAARAAVATAWKLEESAVLAVREGGTIAILPLLEAELECDVVQMAFSQASDAVHLPNERMSRSVLARAVDAIAGGTPAVLGLRVSVEQEDPRAQARWSWSATEGAWHCTYDECQLYLHPEVCHALRLQGYKSIQTLFEASWLVAGTSVNVAAIYGGVPYRDTRDALSRGADLLVATPGRLEDACVRGDLLLRDVRAAVLDEADRMLDLGFEDQIRILLTRRMPRTGSGRQTAMFSATFGIGVQHLAADFLDAYTFVAVGRVGGAAQTVEQRVIWVEDARKAQALLGTLLALESTKGTSPCSILVFANTKDAVRLIEEKVRAWRFRVFSIHGDKKQDAREKALQLFRHHAEGRSSGSRDSGSAVLVATDVAARGLDIPDITCVVHYDLPRRIDDFVHRSGRTGRLGRNGLSIGFANARAKGLSKELVKCLAEAGAKIPPWLLGMAISTGEDLEVLEALGQKSSGGYGAQDVRLQGAGVQTAAERREAQKLRSFAEDAYSAAMPDGSEAPA